MTHSTKNMLIAFSNASPDKVDDAGDHAQHSSILEENDSSELSMADILEQCLTRKGDPNLTPY